VSWHYYPYLPSLVVWLAIDTAELPRTPMPSCGLFFSWPLKGAKGTISLAQAKDMVLRHKQIFCGRSHLIHVIPMDSQWKFALEPFLYPQNITLYDKYIEQVIIDLELVLRSREAIKMNWHQVTKRVTEGLHSKSTLGWTNLERW